MTTPYIVPELRVRPRADWIDRQFHWIAGLLVVLMASAQIGSAIRESPTNDEPVHLTAGYVYLTTGVYGVDLAHPPVGRVLAALPLLNLPLRHIPPEQATSDVHALIWENEIPAETIILRARLVMIVISVLFAVWLGWWTRRHFGSAVALLALAFFGFDPTLIAHGHYVTTDLVASFGIFLTCTLWTDFLLTQERKWLAAAALALGFAVTSKYSALFLLAVLPALYGAAWWRKRGERLFTWRKGLEVLLVMGAGMSLMVAVAYAPEVKKLLFSSGERELPFGFIQGLRELLAHDSGGHAAYFLGEFRTHGWWAYFPVAFLVKTPTGILIACVIAVITLWHSRIQFRPGLLWLCLAAPPLLYFALAVRSSVNIGVRHILPIYPFLYVLVAIVLIEYGPRLLRGAWRATVVAIVVMVGAESLSIYPHYLEFFNWPSGGPANGSRYLLDSNLDWGQDVKELGSYLKEHPMTPLCTALFGPVPASYYGIIGRNLNDTGMPEGVENLPCVVAISANPLVGMYRAPKKYAKLRQRRLVARIGYSIYVYDFR